MDKNKGYDKNQTDLLLDFTRQIYGEIKEIRSELHMAIGAIKDNINSQLASITEQQKENTYQLNDLRSEQKRQGRLVDKMWVLRFAILGGFLLLAMALLNPDAAERILPKFFTYFMGLL